MPDIHNPPLFCGDPYIWTPRLTSAAQGGASSTFLRNALGCWAVRVQYGHPGPKGTQRPVFVRLLKVTAMDRKVLGIKKITYLESTDLQ